MKTGMIPAPSEIVREAIIVIAGALLAAFVISKTPTLKKWIQKQWKTDV